MKPRENNAYNKAKEKREKEQRRIFLEGLKRYKERGVSIIIEGKDCQPEEFEKLFELKEPGAFYMGDYIESDTGKLKEIHFDKVYNK